MPSEAPAPAADPGLTPARIARARHGDLHTTDRQWYLDKWVAAFVFVGTTVFQLGLKGFAGANLLLIAIWVVITVLLLREYRRIGTTRIWDTDARIRECG